MKAMMLPAKINDVTAAWLDEALHENGFFGKDVKIGSIDIKTMGVGEGFQSDMTRIFPSYASPLQGPKSMVIKLPSSYEPANSVAMMFNTYEKEIRFYREIAPFSPIRTPKLYLGEFNTEAKRWVLLMEDCAYCKQIDQVKGLTEPQLRQAILKIADFHAHWWDLPILNTITWMARARSPQAYALSGLYRGCWDMAVNSPDFLSALPPGGKEEGLKIYDAFQTMIEQALVDKPTITHFDFRCDNLFIDESNPADPLLVFDWGAATIYRGPVDVAYMMAESVETGLRRKVESDMLLMYYNRLMEKGVTDYSFDECKTDYMGGLLLYSYIPVLAYSRLDLSNERGKIGAKIVTQRHFSAILDNNATCAIPK
jgi:hypothetical protein